ncbi:MAG TPA: hypothetical protein VHX63_04825 [Acidobacteriaceae bacterium]|jgi:hypothetical protein|nr:hypothetical protein [Acidobacteriaceae bacterium]
MAGLEAFKLKIGRMLTILGVSDPDEVKRKRELYEQQRAARKAREAASEPQVASKEPKP